jgi:hypothetical protein
VAQELHQQAQQYQQQFAQLMEDVQRFNAMLRERDIPNIFLPKPGGSRSRCWKGPISALQMESASSGALQQDSAASAVQKAQVDSGPDRVG